MPLYIRPIITIITLITHNTICNTHTLILPYAGSEAIVLHSKGHLSSDGTSQKFVCLPQFSKEGLQIQNVRWEKEYPVTFSDPFGSLSRDRTGACRTLYVYVWYVYSVCGWASDKALVSVMLCACLAGDGRGTARVHLVQFDLQEAHQGIVVFIYIIRLDVYLDKCMNIVRVTSRTTAASCSLRWFPLVYIFIYIYIYIYIYVYCCCCVCCNEIYYCCRLRTNF